MKPLRFFRWRDWWRLALAVLAGFGLAGCATAPLPSPDARGAGWQTREGQALWHPRGAAPQIAGELLLISHKNGDFVLQFDKTPLTIVAAQRTGSRWQVEFPTRQRRYGGSGTGVPRWLWVVLPEALRGQPLPKGVTFKRDDGSWRLANERTGESIKGFLAP